MTEKFTVYKQDWDSQYFGVECCIVNLMETLTLQDWAQVSEATQRFPFISYANHQSNFQNAKYLGEQTSAYIADITVQLSKIPSQQRVNAINIVDQNVLRYNNELLMLAEYEHSRFLRDEHFRNRGGNDVYREWVKNSLEDANKHFVVKIEGNMVAGFVLYRVEESDCSIELLGVDSRFQRRGIASQLLNSVENKMYEQRIKKLKVGTQSINHPALNLYATLGYKQINQTQIFHMWRK